MDNKDVNMLRFIEMLNELSKKSANGIKSFKEATYDNFDNYVFYDSDSGSNNYKIVMDACLIEHHDIINYYDTYCDYDYSVYVCINEDGSFYIEVDLKNEDDLIVIENGEWYFA